MKVKGTHTYIGADNKQEPVRKDIELDIIGFDNLNLTGKNIDEFYVALYFNNAEDVVTTGEVGELADYKFNNVSAFYNGYANGPEHIREIDIRLEDTDNYYNRNIITAKVSTMNGATEEFVNQLWNELDSIVEAETGSSIDDNLGAEKEKADQRRAQAEEDELKIDGDYPQDVIDEAQKIFDTCKLEGADIHIDNDGVSVLVKDTVNNIGFWFDIFPSREGDLEGDWNKYIFHNNFQDQVENALQNNGRFFEAVFEVAENYAMEKEAIVWNDETNKYEFKTESKKTNKKGIGRYLKEDFYDGDGDYDEADWEEEAMGEEREDVEEYIISFEPGELYDQYHGEFTTEDKDEADDLFEDIKEEHKLDQVDQYIRKVWEWDRVNEEYYETDVEVYFNAGDELEYYDESKKVESVKEENKLTETESKNDDRETAEQFDKDLDGIKETLKEIVSILKDKNETKKEEDLSVEEENKLAGEIEKYLTDNQLYPTDVFAADTRVMVEIKWGDWKHEHLRCDDLMKAKGYNLVEEEVTEEDGSDCYSAIRHYEPKGKFDNIDEAKEVGFEDGNEYTAYITDIDNDLDKLPEDVKYTAVYKLPNTKTKMFLTTRPLTDEERKQYNIRLNTQEVTADELKELFNEAKEHFNKDELSSVRDSIKKALDGLQLTSQGTTGDYEDRALRDDLRNVGNFLDRYLVRIGESKKVTEDDDEDDAIIINGDPVKDLFDDLVRAETFSAEEWNRSSDKERIAMVKPILLKFYKDNKEKIDDNWKDFMDLLEYNNWHTECRILRDLVNGVLTEAKPEEADKEIWEKVEHIVDAADNELGPDQSNEYEYDEHIKFVIYRDFEYEDIFEVYTYVDGNIQEDLDTGDVHLEDLDATMVDIIKKLTNKDVKTEAVDNEDVLMINVYQIQDVENCEYAFMNYEVAKSKGGPDLKDYKKVAEFGITKALQDRDVETILDMAFTYGNIKDDYFKYNPGARSISVSDILEYNGEKYYVDTTGFEKLDKDVETESRYTVYDYADGDTMQDEEEKGLEPSQFTIYDNEVDDFYYDEDGDNPVFDREEDAEEYIKKNLTETKYGDSNPDKIVPDAYCEIEKTDKGYYINCGIGTHTDLGSGNFTIYPEDFVVDLYGEVKSLAKEKKNKGEIKRVKDNIKDLVPMYNELIPEYNANIESMIKNLTPFAEKSKQGQLTRTDLDSIEEITGRVSPNRMSTLPEFNWNGKFGKLISFIGKLELWRSDLSNPLSRADVMTLREASVNKFQTMTTDKDGNEMLLKDTSYNHACSWLEKELAKAGSKVVDTEIKGNKTIIKADNKTKFEYDEEKGTLKRLEEAVSYYIPWEDADNVLLLVYDNTVYATCTKQEYANNPDKYKQEVVRSVMKYENIDKSEDEILNSITVRPESKGVKTEAKKSNKRLDYKLDGFKGVTISVVDKKNGIDTEDYFEFDSMEFGIDEYEFKDSMVDGIKDVLTNLYEFSDAYYDDVFTEDEIDEMAEDITQDVLQLYDDLPEENIDREKGIANLDESKSITEAIDPEAVKEKVEKAKADIGLKQAEETVDTEKELTDGIKKEIIQYAKQQGLDVEKLQKQGQLNSVAEALDNIVGEMVSKSANEFMDTTGKNIEWDFEVKDNNINVIWNEV